MVSGTIVGSDLLVQILTIPAAAVFVGWLGARGVRHLKRTRNELAQDDLELSLLKTYKTERDEALKRADIAFAERNQAVARVGALEYQVANLTAQVAELREQLKQYQEQIRGALRSPPRGPAA